MQLGNVTYFDLDAKAISPPPDVDRALYNALSRDIRRRGIVVPLISSAEDRISRRGLVDPPSSSPEWIDGLKRLSIAGELKITRIPVVLVGNLTGPERLDLRFVLNGLRRQLNRDQLTTLIEWELRKDSGVTDRQVARDTGADHKTVASVRRRLESTGELPQHDFRRGADGRLYNARKPMAFAFTAPQADEVAEALKTLKEEAPSGYSSVRKLRRATGEKKRADLLRGAGPTLPEHFDLRCCDFRDLVLGDEVADCMILDPPWHTEEGLREPFAAAVHRHLKPGGFVLIYTGHGGILQFGDVLRAVGLTERWVITCYNADGAGTVCNYGSVYSSSRLVTVYQKGGVFRAPSVFRDSIPTEVREKDYHPWQQPVSEAIEFVESFTTPGQLVVDLTAGTFTVAVAVAAVGGGRRFLGCELRPELVDLGKRRVAAVLAGRS